MTTPHSISSQIALLEAQAREDIAHWHDLLANGCNDPFWPDGVNLNLVRNHIIYALRRTADLRMSEHQMSLFDVAVTDSGDVMDDPRIPPKVDDNLMVHDRYECGRRCQSFAV